MSWTTIASSFRIVTAADLLAAESMPRSQDVRATITRLTPQTQPLALLFLSHRWESPQHPDPDGRLMQTIRRFLQQVLLVVEAMMVERHERLELVSSLMPEGVLQAEELARRLLGFGPFSDDVAAASSSDAKAIIRAQFNASAGDRETFRRWLATRIGVWLDYTCMPQRPFGPGDEAEFQRTLETLDQLVGTSTLVSFRSGGDDYARRGWCLMEAFMGSARSFARGVTIDIDRLGHGDSVPIPAKPVPAVPNAFAAQVMEEAYQLDLEAFEEACNRWSEFDGPLVEIGPPDPWSAYRSLQGSAFLNQESDPNPFRPALEFVRDLETALIARWLMSPESHVVDVGRALILLMRRYGIRCTDAAELTLGLTLACNGWVDAFRPMLRACLRQISATPARISVDAALAVRLSPLDPVTRDMFQLLHPSSPSTWQSRLAQGAVGREATTVAQMKDALQRHAPEFEVLTGVDRLRSRELILSLVE